MYAKKHNSAFLPVLTVCALFSSTTLSYAEDCNELIRLGLYNVYNSVSEHDSLVSAYHHVCDEQIDKASSSRKTSMNLAFEFLKIKIGPLGGSFEKGLSTETQRTFCEDTNNVNKLYTYNSLNSQTIYDGSLTAWQNCLAMNARGLKTDIRPTSTFSAVSFDLYWTGSVGAKFYGIAQPDLGKASCTVTTNVAGKIVTQLVKPNTQFPLTTKASSFVCNRLMTTLNDGSGTKMSEATRLTIKTSDGSFDIDMPPLVLRRVPIAEINGLHDKIATVEQNIVAQKAWLGKVPITDLQPYHNGCILDFNSRMAACISAAQRYCQAKNYGVIAIIEQWNPDNTLDVGCIK